MSHAEGSHIERLVKYRSVSCLETWLPRTEAEEKLRQEQKLFERWTRWGVEGICEPAILS